MNNNNNKISLEDIHASIDTTSKKGFFRKLLVFVGPAYLISVRYMDPGNWATDIAGGSQFGYRLIWVLLMSNIMAVLLQSHSVRLGIVRGRDLAQASKESYSFYINLILYFLAEIAITACDMAEVLGMAIGLQLLFHIPILWGVALTFLDTFLLLFLINHGMRKMEAFIVALVGIIGMSFFIEVFFAKPDIGSIIKGFIPSISNSRALYLSLGIIGATVMPHNLYLHSSLVQSRRFDRSEQKIREAIKFNIIDSVVALNIAFIVNAAILILAAAAFYQHGIYTVSNISEAHKFLEPLLGTKLAPLLFAIALIASGQSSTLTGTFAGHIVMEGYLNLRIQAWIRRIITRLFAIIPAFITILIFGEKSTGELLILSQVVLSLQLGFAVIPLIHFVSDRKTMGKFAIGTINKLLTWFLATIIVLLNALILINFINSWLKVSEHPSIIKFTLIPIILGGFILQLYIAFIPFVRAIMTKVSHSPHKMSVLKNITTPDPYKRVVIAVDFSNIDNELINNALLVSDCNTKILIIHIVESAGAIVFGHEINDYETLEDKGLLEHYKALVVQQGLECEIFLGFGNPKKIIPEKTKEFQADLLIMGAHGHNMLKDIIFGTTVNKVRHKINIPVLIVKERHL
jgi:manganese transport protein